MRTATSTWIIVFVVFVGAAMTGACARVDTAPGAGTGGADFQGGSGGGAQSADAGPPSFDALANPDRMLLVSQAVCGNGERTANEACDDGNTVSADGCSADCLTVEPGYSCVPAGRACHRIARCGDGVVILPELCDDGNQAAGDGCSPSCKTEVGFKCAGSPSVCVPTVCGDSIVEGAESCDHGDALPFDGCSADCQSEPDCANGACASRCGDGIVVGEACDDGNNISGDGCSADCKIEAGFKCQQPPLGDKMLVPVIYRDFRAKNPTDFEPGAPGRTTALLGIVKPALDVDGKPVYTGAIANSFIASPASFAEWYRNTPGVNHATASKLTLWNNGNGAYVNRFGANGEPWPVTLPAYYCGNVGAELPDPVTGLPKPCTSMFGMTDCDTDLALGYKMLACVVKGGSYVATFQTGTLDGTPLFFPVDGDNFSPAAERSSATLSPPYDPNFTVEAGAPLHNFSFTSEVRYWFQYDATRTYTLAFTGDDDVWLFINKKLAVDLGGIHTPVQGAVTFGAGSPANFGLTDGQVYEVAVFQAERQTSGSSYRLTLSGFSAAPSDCAPICGDGILGIGEECDDGTNPGGYGQCGPDCKLGEYCGDGVVQPDHEDCDDGVNNGHPCQSGCKVLTIN
jgi:fibro-slime domain-containing protein